MLYINALSLLTSGTFSAFWNYFVRNNVKTWRKIFDVQCYFLIDDRYNRGKKNTPYKLQKIIVKENY